MQSLGRRWMDRVHLVKKSLTLHPVIVSGHRFVLTPMSPKGNFTSYDFWPNRLESERKVYVRSLQLLKIQAPSEFPIRVGIF